MRYAGVEDRQVSTYVALVIIVLFGITATSVVLNVIAKVNYQDTVLAQIVN